MGLLLYFEVTSFIINFLGSRTTKGEFINTRKYMDGIVLSDQNNIERICETLQTGYHKMQYFIIDLNWDANAVVVEEAVKVNDILHWHTLMVLLIYERGWSKKSVSGVSITQRHCGNMNKNVNLQETVLGWLCYQRYVALVEIRLYHSKSWTVNDARYQEIGFLLDKIDFKSKHELALDFIKKQIENGISFNYIGADGLYANDMAYARGINHIWYINMLDMYSTQKVYLEKPEPYLAKRKTIKGPSP